MTPQTKLDTEGAATYCGVGKSTLEKLRLTGGGPAYLKPTRSVVYQVSDLDAWLDRHRHGSAATAAQQAAPTDVSPEVLAEIRARYEALNAERPPA